MNISNYLKYIANEGARMAGAVLDESLANQLNKGLLEANIKNSRNGDYLGYLLDSLTLKLDFAKQDSTLLAEITDEEIAALIAEVHAHQSIKKEENSHEQTPF